MGTFDIRRWHYFFSGCLLAVSFSVTGQITSFIEEEYPSPPDMSSLHFYLITVDVGEDVWNNFGHTALRLFDESSNTDMIYNWGVFDISGGVLGFSWEFFTGVMIIVSRSVLRAKSLLPMPRKAARYGRIR
jgi:hypothetical protein